MTGARGVLGSSACKRSAVISDCGRFRYRLSRRWDDDAPLLYVMLNPSTADGEQDDPTIRRCTTFALAHGFGAFEVVNLFAYRATKPADLAAAGWPVGPDNDAHITAAASSAGLVCAAWGANAAGLARPQAVLSMLLGVGTPIACLGLTRSGYPRHPLMLSADHVLRPFNGERARARG